MLGALMALPLAGACAAGLGSVGLAFAYVLTFDFLRAMGHCNVELFPGGLFRSLPFLRYLIYTPTYVRCLPASPASNTHSTSISPWIVTAELKIHHLEIC